MAEAENRPTNFIRNIIDKDFLILAEIIMIYLKINFILIIFFKNT